MSLAAGSVMSWYVGVVLQAVPAATSQVFWWHMRSYQVKSHLTRGSCETNNYY